MGLSTEVRPLEPTLFGVNCPRMRRCEKCHVQRRDGGAVSVIARAGIGGLAVSLVAIPALAAGENYDVAMGFFLALCFFLSFLFYIIPGLVAWDRRHAHVRAIWALTLLLGWTGIAWLLALIWAFQPTDAHRGTPRARPADPA
jgi:hypothetical protein